MLIQIRVTPNAKREKIKKDGDLYKVYLVSPPQKGKANKELIKFLAKYFKVKKIEVQIKKGEKSRNKLVEILI